MLIVDLVLAVFLVGFVVNGYRRGLILTVGQLVGIVVGFLLARLWSPFVLSRVTMLVPSHPAIAYGLSFLAVFVVMDRAVNFVFHLIDMLFQILTIIPFLSTINHLLGAIIGIIAGITFIGGGTYLVLTFQIDPRAVQWASQSQIAMWSQARVLPLIQRII